jgi:hypothetical protein
MRSMSITSANPSSREAKSKCTLFKSHSLLFGPSLLRKLRDPRGRFVRIFLRIRTARTTGYIESYINISYVR